MFANPEWVPLKRGAIAVRLVLPLLLVLWFAVGSAVRAEERPLTRTQVVDGFFNSIFMGRSDYPAVRWLHPPRVVIVNATPKEDVLTRNYLSHFNLAMGGYGVKVVDSASDADIFVMFINDSYDEVLANPQWRGYAEPKGLQRLNLNIRFHQFPFFMSIGGSGQGDINYAITIVKRESGFLLGRNLINALALGFGLVGRPSPSLRSVLSSQVDDDELSEFDILALRFLYTKVRPAMSWAEAHPDLERFLAEKGL